MTDELDGRLNGSSPPISASVSIDDELTALAYSTQRIARLSRRSRWRRIGVPILVGAMALGGTGAALASPVVQRSLGISQDRPKAVKPFPKVSVALPLSGCTLTLQLTNGSTQPLGARGIESLQAATNYLSHVDMIALEQSPVFKANYRPVAFETKPGETPAEVADDRQFNDQLNRMSEEQAASQALSAGMVDAADKSGQDPEALGSTGRLTCPGGPS
jgi:hypothetical protein